MPVVLTACQEGSYAYEYHHGTISYGVFTYALAKEFRKAQSAREPDLSLNPQSKRVNENPSLRSNLWCGRTDSGASHASVGITGKNAFSLACSRLAVRGVAG